MDAIIRMRGISKSFGSLRANDSIDFELYPGETHALVGENGAGKTTLMRILYGQYKADSGTIEVDGKPVTYNVAGAMKLGIGMVHQNFMQIEKMSILENIIMASAPSRFGFIRYKETRGKVQEMLRRFGLEVSPDVPIGRLCVGERQKVEIIKALYLGARVLILDEPTAVLTPQETTELFRIIEELKGEGKSIIFISHKLREVVQVGDRITVIRAGQVVAQMARGVQENDIARAMIHRQDTELIKNDRTGEIGECVCKAEHLWYFDDLSVPRLKDFSMEVHAGEILGIGGLAGQGKLGIPNGVMGLYEAGGTVEFDGKPIPLNAPRRCLDAQLAFVSEDRRGVGLLLDESLEWNIAFPAMQIHDKFLKSLFGGLVKWRDEKAIRAVTDRYIDELKIKCTSSKQKAKELSGGNQQKVCLAKAFALEPKFLFVSEPTRGIDVGAKSLVLDALKRFNRESGITVVMISSELEELRMTCDRIAIVSGGRIAGILPATESSEAFGMLMVSQVK